MFRRTMNPLEEGSSSQPSSNTLITGLPTPQSAEVVAPRSSLKDRFRAAGIHLLVCILVAALVLALVFGAWYPSPMAWLLGTGTILALILGIDVIVGPIFTALVFDRRKPRLKWDLTVIAVVQLTALGYGLHTLYQGRPAFVVLVKDRYELVSPADLTPEAREDGRENPLARIDLLRPRWVAALQPKSGDEQLSIMMEAGAGGRDIQHHPKLYVELASERETALQRALPISRLRSLNPTRGNEIDALLARLGRSEDSLRFLPIRGRDNDGAVLIDARDASVVEIARFVPW